MSESLVGVSVAATRQKAGAAVNTRARPVTGGGVPGATNAPAAIGSAAVTVACGSARLASDSHDAASRAAATARQAITRRMVVARILSDAPQRIPGPRQPFSFGAT